VICPEGKWFLVSGFWFLVGLSVGVGKWFSVFGGCGKMCVINHREHRVQRRATENSSLFNTITLIFELNKVSPDVIRTDELSESGRKVRLSTGNIWFLITGSLFLVVSFFDLSVLFQISDLNT
jgi:hypothetical protein